MYGGLNVCLYTRLDLTVVLWCLQQVSTYHDEVMSYIGLRKWSLDKAGDLRELRVYLNNKPFVFFGPLDQVNTLFLPT